ncbi:hypothetical protein NDN08_008188 [Rhodosorus marinus]|uniref:Prostaglandin E synthase 2 n=1 Tax=Rhodosorus marinus TaxID=101924 RepID=A0AAV8V3K0_9RHOD|nr:hypothetical protein NDN08_008188 [Rhodosorus marinus]
MLSRGRFAFTRLGRASAHGLGRTSLGPSGAPAGLLGRLNDVRGWRRTAAALGFCVGSTYYYDQYYVAHSDQAVAASVTTTTEVVPSVSTTGDSEVVQPYSPISERGLEISKELRKTVKTKEDLEIVLYQYQPCPFCNKVRAFLDYHKIPYRAVEVDPLRKAELKWSDYKKVPVVVVNGNQLNESTEIIATLETVLSKELKEEMFTEEEKKWLFWLDDYFVHLLPPNIYRTATESMQTFDYLTTEGNFSWFVRETSRYSGAVIMYLVAKKLQKKYNIGDPREDLYGAVTSWVDTVNEKGTNFLGGSEPNVADLAVFGVLRSLLNFDTFDDLMANTELRPWYERMEIAVGEPSRLKD